MRRPFEAPFGFDTRVVAIWRGSENAESIGLTRLVRRVALIAAAVTIIAAAGAYREAGQSRESNEPLANEFAIADSAIQSEVSAMNFALKWKLIAGFLLVFIAGGMTGAFFGASHARHLFFESPRHGIIGERMRERLRAQLNLTPEQVAKISPIIDKTAAQLEQERRDTGKRVHELMIGAASRNRGPSLPKRSAPNCRKWKRAANAGTDADFIGANLPPRNHRSRSHVEGAILSLKCQTRLRSRAVIPGPEK